jgi:hypothetical protein
LLGRRGLRLDDDDAPTAAPAPGEAALVPATLAVTRAGDDNDFSESLFLPISISIFSSVIGLGAAE